VIAVPPAIEFPPITCMTESNVTGIVNAARKIAVPASLAAYAPALGRMTLIT